MMDSVTIDRSPVQKFGADDAGPAIYDDALKRPHVGKKCHERHHEPAGGERTCRSCFGILISSGRHLCWTHPQGREAGGPASRAGDQVRASHQRRHREDARPQRARQAARRCRRGDRVKPPPVHHAARRRSGVAARGKRAAASAKNRTSADGLNRVASPADIAPTPVAAAPKRRHAAKRIHKKSAPIGKRSKRAKRG
jgi:hypothetical protein